MNEQDSFWVAIPHEAIVAIGEDSPNIGVYLGNIALILGKQPTTDPPPKAWARERYTKEMAKTDVTWTERIPQAIEKGKQLVGDRHVYRQNWEDGKLFGAHFVTREEVALAKALSEIHSMNPLHDCENWPMADTVSSCVALRAFVEKVEALDA